MPAKSKQQFDFMQGVASGEIKKKGITPKQAAEFIKGQSPKGLPVRVKKKK